MEKLRRILGWTLGVVLVVALLLRILVLDVWTMSDDAYQGAAAAPVLAAGDTMLLITRGEPSFGELVRCADPQDPASYVIGRIAGVEGDTVELEGGRLVVNGRTYESESACSQQKVYVKHPETLKDVELLCGIVPMGGGWHYRVSSPNPFQEQKKNAKVGPGKVFLASDNRAMHDDSRDYGLVDRATCRARPVFRLWGKGPWADDPRRLSYIR
jgi:signal peptidase I